MEKIKIFLKKYGAYIAVGLIGLYALYKYAFRGTSGTASQVVNRVIPVSTDSNSSDNLGMAQLQAQYNLGKLQLQNSAAIADKQIEAEKQRLDYQNKALEIQGNFGIKALEIEAQKVANQSQLNSDLAKVALDTSIQDTRARANAALELQRQQANQNYLNQLLGVGSGILQSLLKGGLQQSSRQTPSIGSSSGSAGASSQGGIDLARKAAQARLAAYLSGIRNTNYFAPVTTSTGAYALPPASGYDLQPYYNREIQTFDNWLNYNPFDLNFPNATQLPSADFQTINYDPTEIANYFGYSDINTLLNDYGYDSYSNFIYDYYYPEG